MVESYAGGCAVTCTGGRVGTCAGACVGGRVGACAGTCTEPDSLLINNRMI